MFSCDSIFSTKGIANYTTATSLCSILGEEIDLGVVTLKLDKCQTNTTFLDFNFLKMKNQITYINVHKWCHNSVKYYRKVNQLEKKPSADVEKTEIYDSKFYFTIWHTIHTMKNNAEPKNRPII